MATSVSLGGLLAGLKIADISSMLVMDNFAEYFSVQMCLKKGLIVSFLTLGCFLGSVAVGPLASKMSRKQTLAFAGVTTMVGVGLELGAVNLFMFLCARIISGFGIGVLSATVPMYMTEISHKTIRGRMISLLQLSMTFGIMAAYWINTGFNNVESSSFQWRGVFMTQLIICILFTGSVAIMPESPKWLAAKGKSDQVIKSLTKLRGAHYQDEDIINEARDIEAEVRTENYKKTSYFSLITQQYRRLTLGVLLQVFKQLTGVSTILYYIVYIVKEANITPKTGVFVAASMVGVVGFISTIPAVMYIDKFGRRNILLFGSFGSTICHLGIVVTCLYGGAWNINDKYGYYNPTCAWTGLVFMYIFLFFYSVSWGPIGWIYPPEIFSTNMRAKATSITTATNWLMTSLVGFITPFVLNRLGWGLYLIYGGCMFFSIIFVWAFCPETKGKSFIQIEAEFTSAILVRNMKSS
ncbi:Hexose transporter HXT17 [Zancudomyces culisetae]|uniref:Hexose transporter HXT17 n=1 Tax=Zancudomyces culisetae TaxID=1213189 RepID=A0A1R1PY57_ZANCU|nr:Hexose transporter HXT17 [Zancudomyces culisetae]|eukprot:OMH85858.1 Hexose transporter HXT17 [Zancudomyces culisetae]